MRVVLGMLTFVGVLNIVQTVMKPTLKPFWPSKTQQAVSGCSVGLLIGAVAALAMGFFAESSHTITIGAILLWAGAMTRACALIVQAKESELQSTEISVG